MLRKGALPELLCPAGSPAALAAAIEGGADAVYFGGPTFNARMRAENFTAKTMRENIRLCHAFGVRAYITMNTLLFDRELNDFLHAAAEAGNAGADALIVADIGAMRLLHRELPGLSVHASTQAGAHSLGAAAAFAELGITRVVLARETPKADMARFVRESGLETEVFVHGALCVSHSGQCLFSSLVGGRSGNRGECAQPCRLPDAAGRFPLSLKDLSLASHLPELIEMGVDSLKIEGRLKSPEYVRDVTRIFRLLLDERRGATPAEMTELSDIFSRGGFTDGYFTGHVDARMMGVRSERDKEKSRNITPFKGLSRKVSLSFSFCMKKGVPVTLTAAAGGRRVTVAGEEPLVAETCPMDEAALSRNLSRLGGTPYEIKSLSFSIESGLMIPLSKLNALRRAAIEALEADNTALPFLPKVYAPARKKGKSAVPDTARFLHAAQITPEATDFFEIRYLPLEHFAPPANGVVVPPVIFDHEEPAVKKSLAAAKAAGAEHALVGNPGHIRAVLEAGLIPHGDFRLNLTNQESVEYYLSLGLCDLLLSPELKLPQIRDMSGPLSVILYGRVPLMLLEKCAGQALLGCEACGKDENRLFDRQHAAFPVIRLSDHRNILYNCRPTYMADRKKELRAAGITAGHWIFTVENPAEINNILQAYRKELPPKGAVRRI